MTQALAANIVRKAEADALAELSHSDEYEILASLFMTGMDRTWRHHENHGMDLSDYADYARHAGDFRV